MCVLLLVCDISDAFQAQNSQEVLRTVHTYTYIQVRPNPGPKKLLKKIVHKF